MNDDIRAATKNVKRIACNRCHELKSRCSRSARQSSCDRCQRIGLPCEYSSPLRLGRPKGSGSGGASKENLPGTRTVDNQADERPSNRKRQQTRPSTDNDRAWSEHTVGESNSVERSQNDVTGEGSIAWGTDHVFQPASISFSTEGFQGFVSTSSADDMASTVSMKTPNSITHGTVQPVSLATSPTTVLAVVQTLLTVLTETFSTADTLHQDQEDEYAVYDPTIGNSAALYSTTDTEMILSPNDEVLLSPFDNFLTDIASGVETAPIKSQARQPHSREGPGASGFASATSVTPQPSRRSSPSPFHEYETNLSELSGLQMKLHRLSISSSNKKTQVDAIASSLDTNATPDTTIDETFAATETLISILKSLYSRPISGHQSKDPPTQAFMNILVDPSQGTSSNSSSSTSFPNPQSDTATTLLLLTCYLRLLQIYESLAASLHQHLRQAHQGSRPISSSSSSSPARLPVSRITPGKGTSPSSPPIPSFSIGSFSMPPSSHLNTALLLHLTSQMVERIHRTVRDCVPITANTNLTQGQHLTGATSITTNGSCPRYYEHHQYQNLAHPIYRNHDVGSATWSGSPMGQVAEAALKEIGVMEKRLLATLRAADEMVRA
ncbi:MAG: hypothetical protein Q9214_005081 [Letrouitia sp. 1 TL-2023]